MARWNARVFNPGRRFHYGVLRPLRAVCLHADGHPPRNEQLALASIFLCVHDDSRLHRRFTDVSDRNASVRKLSPGAPGINYFQITFRVDVRLMLFVVAAPFDGTMTMAIPPRIATEANASLT